MSTGNAALTRAYSVVHRRPEPFVMAVAGSGSYNYLTVAGDLDLATLAPFEDELARHPRPRVATMVLDLSHVSFCSCRGIRSLERLRDRTERCGVQLELVVRNPGLRRSLTVLGLVDRFSVHASRATALRAVATRR